MLSFDALRLVFVACGINPYLSWGGPVCVDGTILLCTWATWGFKKGHIRGSAYPWVGLVLFSSFSIAGNACMRCSTPDSTCRHGCRRSS